MTTDSNKDHNYKMHINKIKKQGKPYCTNCYDDRDTIDLKENICVDCRYIFKMLNKIKKI